MNILWIFWLSLFFGDHRSCGVRTSERPHVVQIGSMLTFDSVIGRVAKVALKAAVDDVNSSHEVLKGTMLNITILDGKVSTSLGIIEALRFSEAETVAIIGPQYPAMARVLSYLMNELHVPLLSFTATDPTLSSLQFPYLVRTSPSDLFQMAAISDLIKYYGWREAIAIYVDDDYGRNGIAELADQMSIRDCFISYRAPVKRRSTFNDVRDALVQLALAGPRIFIVHSYPELGMRIMAVAQHLGMLNKGYVWIATNWLSTLLDTNCESSSDAMKSIQGVVSLRVHTQESEAKKNLFSRWDELVFREEANRGPPMGLSTYGLYAYDTVWLLARAIDSFLENGGNVSFTSDTMLQVLQKGTSSSVNVFDGGYSLLDTILNVSWKGVTGPFKFTSDRNVEYSNFEIINFVGNGYRRIGYWSNYSGLSVSPPKEPYNITKGSSISDRRLYSVIWPGETTEKPRGWVFPKNGRPLKIAVPNRVSFRDFVSESHETNSFTGYCIDVFLAAVSLLPYTVPYELVPYGDGRNNPSNTELVQLIASGVYDAAVGDISITPNRTKMADFTQPYIESDLVVVAPIKQLGSGIWAFLRPFTWEMWFIMGFFILLTGAVLWTLEHRINEDFRGPPRKQVVTVLWFSFSTLFSSHREDIISALGRIVLFLWLFLILIVKASYTANLTSILTMCQLSSPIKGIETILKGDDPIGYQQGSFARDYMVEQLGVKESRLIPLMLAEDYAKTLNAGPGNGGVSVVVDERAYAELFLSTQCQFSIVGRGFTKSGWGFAFPRDSPLAVDMSTAILQLSEKGDLKRIHDKWLLSRIPCTSQGAKLEVEQLPLSSFQGLFLLAGLACFAALLLYVIMVVRQFNKHYDESSTPLSQSSRSVRVRSFLSFADTKEEMVRSHSLHTSMGSSLRHQSDIMPANRSASV